MPLSHCLYLSAFLFGLGAVGVLVRRNILIMLMSIEIMLNATNLAFVAFSRWWEGIGGQVLAFFSITVAAAEVAVGLAIALVIFRSQETVDVDTISEMKW